MPVLYIGRTVLKGQYFILQKAPGVTHTNFMFRTLFPYYAVYVVMR